VICTSCTKYREKAAAWSAYLHQPGQDPYWDRPQDPATARIPSLRPRRPPPHQQLADTRVHATACHGSREILVAAVQLNWRHSPHWDGHWTGYCQSPPAIIATSTHRAKWCCVGTSPTPWHRCHEDGEEDGPARLHLGVSQARTRAFGEPTNGLGGLLFDTSLPAWQLAISLAVVAWRCRHSRIRRPTTTAPSSSSSLKNQVVEQPCPPLIGSTCPILPIFIPRRYPKIEVHDPH